MGYFDKKLTKIKLFFPFGSHSEEGWPSPCRLSGLIHNSHLPGYNQNKGVHLSEGVFIRETTRADF